MPEPLVGWDVGGAHLKAVRLSAHGAVEAVVQLPCPLWLGLTHLERSLADAEAALGPAAVHAVTMTGEMVDLFSSRREGVIRLVTLMRERFPGSALRFYGGDAGFLDADGAMAAPDRIASANWMASASLVASAVPDALLLDIGSTTSDLVPVTGGKVRALGRDDAARLMTGELVYTGVVRTPVIALAAEVLLEGMWVPVMAEWFATAADVHRLCGRLPDEADQQPAADGGEKTIDGSARRLARMVGRDAESLPLDAWRRLAAWLAGVQSDRLRMACERLIARELLPDGAPIVGAGVGRFVARDLADRLGRRYLDFASLVSLAGAESGRVSDCAPAVAVAWLAQRSLG